MSLTLTDTFYSFSGPLCCEIMTLAAYSGDSSSLTTLSQINADIQKSVEKLLKNASEAQSMNALTSNNLIFNDFIISTDESTQSLCKAQADVEDEDEEVGANRPTEKKLIKFPDLLGRNSLIDPIALHSRFPSNESSQQASGESLMAEKSQQSFHIERKSLTTNSTIIELRRKMEEIVMEANQFATPKPSEVAAAVVDGTAVEMAKQQEEAAAMIEMPESVPSTTFKKTHRRTSSQFPLHLLTSSVPQIRKSDTFTSHEQILAKSMELYSKRAEANDDDNMNSIDNSEPPQLEAHKNAPSLSKEVVKQVTNFQ